MAAASHIRDVVFCREQGVSPEEEWDGQDDACDHFVLYEGGTALAGARARPFGPGAFKIERVAVLKEQRGRGLGKAIMSAVIDRMGASTALLNAQTGAEGFYRRLGFVAEGGVFQEAGIDHVKMVRRSR